MLKEIKTAIAEALDNPKINWLDNKSLSDVRVMATYLIKKNKDLTEEQQKEVIRQFNNEKEDFIREVEKKYNLKKYNSCPACWAMSKLIAKEK